MISQELFELLNENKEKTLRFEYQKGKFVNQNFHITEVKNLQINSVDCGGRSDSWNETVLQLWNPSSESERYPMKSSKALSILEKVDQIDAIDKNATLYFEYGNEDIAVSNYSVQNITIDEDFITFHFASITTQCKPSVENANNGSSCCGTTENVSKTEDVECCDTALASANNASCCA